MRANRAGQRREAPDGEVGSTTIDVTQANHLMRRLHDGMPVIFSPADFDDWLKTWPVSTRVNKPARDDPECVERLEADGQRRSAGI